MRPLELIIRGTWNAGSDIDEATTFINRKSVHEVVTHDYVASRFAIYEKHLGIAPFPSICITSVKCFNDATGVVSHPVDHSKWSDEYKRWKGVTGAGLALREICAHRITTM